MNDTPPELEALLANLGKEYTQQLPEKVQRIDALWTGLLNSWNEENFHTLYRSVHNLSGSCARFGYPAVSDAARRLEHELQVLLDLDGRNPTLPTPEQNSQISKQLDALKEALNHFQPGPTNG